MDNRKHWISYSKNWKDLKPGDKVFVESLQNMVLDGYITCSGDVQYFKILKKEEVEPEKVQFIGTGLHGNSIFNESNCNQDDIHSIPPSFSLPLGVKLKFYIQKKQHAGKKTAIFFKKIFNKIFDKILNKVHDTIQGSSI